MESIAMIKKAYSYQQGAQALQGYLAYEPTTGKKPAVLVVHDWSGLNDFAKAKAESLAALGYVGFAVDMYGEGRTGNTNEQKMALMQPLVHDRALLKERILAAYKTVAALPEVDSDRIAAIGFCFGGLCVLDLARAGAPVQGVVSFHGILNPPTGLAPHEITAKVLVLHGYDDPMVKPDAVNTFCQEMNAAQADWQVHMYGQVQHAFTNPLAHDHALGTVYNARAEERAMQSMQQFLAEVLNQG